MTEARKKDGLSFFSRFSFLFLCFGGKQIFLGKLQNCGKFSFFKSNGRLKEFEESRSANSISAGFADKFGRKNILQYGFRRKIKKRCSKKEKRDKMFKK
jgi:hypothetical protein